MFKNIGLIGGGVMGIGTAQNLAENNFNVILIDISDEILNKAKIEIEKNIRFQKLFNKEDKTDPAHVLSRIIFTKNYNLLEDAEYIIENVTENWAVKREIHQKLDKIIEEGIIIAANTSAIPITKIASIYKSSQSEIIGIHFMNPVPMKPAVEVIKGFHTSEETIKKTLEFLKSFGKEGIVINDSPGFVSNRVLMLTINEAIFLLHEQVASAEDVDKIFKKCFGHKMGPLETADLIGLDTILRSIEVLHDNFKDSKFRPCPLLSKMVDAGLHGRKSGKGFYNYNNVIQK